MFKNVISIYIKNLAKIRWSQLSNLYNLIQGKQPTKCLLRKDCETFDTANSAS